MISPTSASALMRRALARSSKGVMEAESSIQIGALESSPAARAIRA